jgi:uncharacterized protein (TIGR02996 family)
MSLQALADAALTVVLDHPEEDAPRLAYADVVADRDPERAELIRIQVELARGRRTHTRPASWSSLYRRQLALLHRCGAEWAAPVQGLAVAHDFRRGFVEEVTVEAAVFLARAAELYRRAPIRHLTLRSARGLTGPLFASPALARLESLSLYKNAIGDEGAAQLADSPHLAGLRWLDLGFNDIGMTGLEAIAASSKLPALGYLGFQGNKVDDPTPSIGGIEDSGVVHDMEYPALGKELVRRFGGRAWLTTPVRSDWPPDRDAV